VKAISSLRCRSCQIDGEAVVCDDAGLASFNLLRSGSRVKADAFVPVAALGPTGLCGDTLTGVRSRTLDRRARFPGKGADQ
jgi:hypothetical protein